MKISHKTIFYFFLLGGFAFSLTACSLPESGCTGSNCENNEGGVLQNLTALAYGERPGEEESEEQAAQREANQADWAAASAAKNAALNARQTIATAQISLTQCHNATSQDINTIEQSIDALDQLAGRIDPLADEVLALRNFSYQFENTKASYPNSYFNSDDDTAYRASIFASSNADILTGDSAHDNAEFQIALEDTNDTLNVISSLQGIATQILQPFDEFVGLLSTIEEGAPETSLPQATATQSRVNNTINEAIAALNAAQSMNAIGKINQAQNTAPGEERGRLYSEMVAAIHEMGNQTLIAIEKIEAAIAETDEGARVASEAADALRAYVQGLTEETINATNSLESLLVSSCPSISVQLLQIFNQSGANFFDHSNPTGSTTTSSTSSTSSTSGSSSGSGSTTTTTTYTGTFTVTSDTSGLEPTLLLATGTHTITFTYNSSTGAVTVLGVPVSGQFGGASGLTGTSSDGTTSSNLTGSGSRNGVTFISINATGTFLAGSVNMTITYRAPDLMVATYTFSGS